MAWQHPQASQRAGGAGALRPGRASGNTCRRRRRSPRGGLHAHGDGLSWACPRRPSGGASRGGPLSLVTGWTSVLTMAGVEGPSRPSPPSGWPGRAGRPRRVGPSTGSRGRRRPAEQGDGVLGSSYWLRMTTPVPGWRFAHLLAASMPSRWKVGGIRCPTRRPGGWRPRRRRRARRSRRRRPPPRGPAGARHEGFHALADDEAVVGEEDGDGPQVRSVPLALATVDPDEGRPAKGTTMPTGVVPATPGSTCSHPLPARA